MNLNFLDYESKLKEDFLNLLGKDKYEGRDLEELFHLYFNKINKQISKRNYKVFISDKLKNIQNPHKDIVLKIKKDFENINVNLLNKRLSTASIKEDENDLLLNNWGIYHFHLGKKNNKDFSVRTNLLLFIKIISNNVYFLDLKEHGNFSSIDFIKIMHDNWENAIKDFRVTSLVDIEPKFNEKEVFKIWKMGGNAILTFLDNNNNEVAYMPIGGGINLTKSSNIATSQWLNLIRSLPKIDKELKSKCYLRFDSIGNIFHIQNENGKNLFTFEYNE